MTPPLQIAEGKRMKKLVSLMCYVMLLGLSLAKAYPAEDTKELTPEQPMTNDVLEKVLQDLKHGVKGDHRCDLCSPPRFTARTRFALRSSAGHHLGKNHRDHLF